MKLIRSEKMHLSRQGGMVTEVAEVVHHCRGRSRHFALVIEYAHFRSHPSRQHGESRRRANRVRAIGGIEYRPFVGHSLKIGHFYDRVAVGRQESRIHLVCHDKKNIGLFGHPVFTFQLSRLTLK